MVKSLGNVEKLASNKKIFLPDEEEEEEEKDPQSRQGGEDYWKEEDDRTAPTTALGIILDLLRGIWSCNSINIKKLYPVACFFILLLLYLEIGRAHV